MTCKCGRELGLQCNWCYPPLSWSYPICYRCWIDPREPPHDNCLCLKITGKVPGKHMVTHWRKLGKLPADYRYHLVRKSLEYFTLYLPFFEMITKFFPEFWANEYKSLWKDWHLRDVIPFLDFLVKHHVPLDKKFICQQASYYVAPNNKIFHWICRHFQTTMQELANFDVGWKRFTFIGRVWRISGILPSIPVNIDYNGMCAVELTTRRAWELRLQLKESQAVIVKQFQGIHLLGYTAALRPLHLPSYVLLEIFRYIIKPGILTELEIIDIITLHNEGHKMSNRNVIKN